VKCDAIREFIQDYHLGNVKFDLVDRIIKKINLQEQGPRIFIMPKKKIIR